MTTYSSPITPPSNATVAPSSAAASAASAEAKTGNQQHQQVVTCVSGGYRFALPTNHLSGVYQVTRQQMGQDMDVLETPEGKLPVASLSTLLSLHLGLDLKPSDDERALVAIRSENQIATIRVGQVSRPIDVPTQHWHKMPTVANPNDSNNLFSHIVNLNPQSSDPNEALALAVDPMKALQFEGKSPSSLSEEVRSASTKGKSSESQANGLEGILPERRASGQLLAFAPEDVPRQDINFVFCLPLAAVAEVVTAHDVLKSPLSSDLFSGYILWRKMPVPVIKLGGMFGLNTFGPDKRNRHRERRLVIARVSGHRYVGFYTQTQMHSMKAPSSNPIELEALAGTPLLGAFKTEVGAMVIPDLKKILDS